MGFVLLILFLCSVSEDDQSLNQTKMELSGLNYNSHGLRSASSPQHLFNIIPTVKHGSGSILLWGEFSAATGYDNEYRRRLNKQPTQECFVPPIKAMDMSDYKGEV